MAQVPVNAHALKLHPRSDEVIGGVGAAGAAGSGAGGDLFGFPGGLDAGPLLAVPDRVLARVAELTRSQQRLFWALWRVRDHATSLCRIARAGLRLQLNMKRSTFSGAFAGLVSVGVLETIELEEGGRDPAGCEVVRLCRGVIFDPVFFQPDGQNSERSFDELNECSTDLAPGVMRIGKRARACMEGMSYAQGRSMRSPCAEAVALIGTRAWAEGVKTRGVRWGMEALGAFGRLVDAVESMGVEADELVSVARSVAMAPVEKSVVWLIASRLASRRKLPGVPGFGRSRAGAETVERIQAMRRRGTP